MSKDIIISKLSELNVECYAIPVENDDTLVVLGRIQGDPSTPAFVNNQNRLIYFVEKALLSAEDDAYKENDALRLRFSRLWLLKDGALRYTWDFTFKGDLDKASELMSSIVVPVISVTRTEEVSTQAITSKRGKVSQVRVGAL